MVCFLILLHPGSCQTQHMCYVSQQVRHNFNFVLDDMRTLHLHSVLNSFLLNGLLLISSTGM
jgi:hypothetical protein